MATVKVFAIPGMKFWFPSLDHTPPHFHAKNIGEWHIKVHFLVSQREMVELKSGKLPSSRVLKSITDQAEAHRAELLTEWVAIHENQ